MTYYNMKGKKTSSEDKAKVIEAKIQNPDLSHRDLEKKTWVSKSVTATILKNELGQVRTQSEHIAKLIDDNNKLIALSNILLLRRAMQDVETWKDKVSGNVLIQAKNDAFKQNQLLTDKPTEHKRFTLEDLRDMTDDQLLELMD